MKNNIYNTILSKSNQYNYYKTNFEKLEKKNKELTIELETLKKECESLKNDYEKNLINKKNENKALSFCDWSYIDFYYRDDFDKYFTKMLSGLSSKSKRQFKLIFIRTLTAIYMHQQTFFSDEELKEQEIFSEFQNSEISKNKIGEFKVVDDDYNIHSFINTGLNYEDKNFLKNKDIIDAGAYTGDSALPLSKITSKNVYGFEPFEKSYEKMKKNINLNNVENIIPINASLGDIDGEISLYLSGENFQGITLDPNTRKYDKEIKVESKTIDSFVKENNLDVGFIKVDVEGGEQKLLKGAINTIKTQKPILFLSIYHNPDDFFNIKPWIESLNLGYEFEINKEQPWTFIADTILECRPKKE